MIDITGKIQINYTDNTGIKNIMNDHVRSWRIMASWRRA